MWWENKKEVDRLNQEFTEYKKKTDEKMKVVDSLQKDMYGIRTKFAEETKQSNERRYTRLCSSTKTQVGRETA